MKIVLDVGNLTDEEQERVRQLLRDAFGEFSGARGDDGYLDEPAATLQYIRKRYPNLEGQARERKIDEVMLRKQLAKKLRRAADDVVIERATDVGE